MKKIYILKLTHMVNEKKKLFMEEFMNKWEMNIKIINIHNNIYSK